MRLKLPQSPSSFLILLLLPLVCYGISTVNNPSSSTEVSRKFKRKKAVKHRKKVTFAEISSQPVQNDANDSTFQRSEESRPIAADAEEHKTVLAGDCTPHFAGVGEVQTDLKDNSSDTETESESDSSDMFSISSSEKQELEIAAKAVQLAFNNVDEKRHRARKMKIEITLDDGGKPLSGFYSGALSHTRKPDGAGIIKFDNGGMYIGLMKDGEMHGYGTLVNRGRVLRGEFEHNMLVVRTRTM